MTHADPTASPSVAGAGSASIPCRLCGEPAAHRFTRQVLRKYDVGYFECSGCGSLQTEAPHWLSEAYASNLADIDTGAAQRNLNNLAVTWSICGLFRRHDVVDFGGGDGLLCRLLRDHGINCYVQDKYARTTYAAAFKEPDFRQPDLLMSFEVFEHFAHPATDLGGVFASAPRMLLISTVLHAQQGPDWPYLATDAGQHVFFYSPRAIRLIAERYGYEARTVGAFTLFSRPGAVRGWRAALLKVLLRHKTLRLLQVVISALPKRGVQADLVRLKRAGQ